jgi:hypothetical protein
MAPVTEQELDEKFRLKQAGKAEARFGDGASHEQSSVEIISA